MTGPTIHLIIHNVICIVSGITTIGMALFTYLNGPRKTANITWTLMLLAIAIFVISHVIGVNIADPNISKALFMFNLSVFFIGVFNIHAVLALLGQDKEKKSLLIFLYVTAAFCTIFFLIFPDLFLLPSVPKMYLPNYYNPGILNWTRVAYLYGVTVPFMIYLLAKTILRTKPGLEKTQHTYLMWTIIIGYAIGSLPNLLVYNVQFDPAIGMLFVNLFALPFVYGAVKYGLFNVKVIAQQAFGYSIAVAIIGGLITFFNYSTNWVQTAYPTFPLWTVHMASALLVVTVSMIVWRRLRESDILKYEFITTATHKFRTPLTHIKWASENLSKETNLSEDEKSQLSYIQEANTKLVELTNLLVNASETEGTVYGYHHERGDVSALVEEVVSGLGQQLVNKRVSLTKALPSGMHAMFDESRLKFVIQTLIENGIDYAPNDATISVSIERRGKNIVCSVKDSGIGIPKDEIPLLFSKFYRGRQAKLTDTEGMGIGLFMCKEIIARHKGHIWAESDGSGKGSTFNFSLPAAE
jgi:signal transduction histidine kinase